MQKEDRKINTPKVELPKGGGAVKGIGETFQPTAFSGTGSYSIPLPLPSGRGFTPALALGYNSGSGNGPLGIGFDLSLPEISVRTEKGIPKYDGSEVFLLSGAVIVEQQNTARQQKDDAGNDW